MASIPSTLKRRRWFLKKAPEFKTVECLRPEYRTVTTQVPYTKSIPYKVKSMVTKALPPKIIDEPKILEIHHSHPCSHNEAQV
ncbi:hypothetical protein DSO57_1025117 [Entomophthora muscae]|uniref:Uncharacterized protein n=1 Tax=Entomophthora muscae TaxID=34485 RepID=A0ACC2UN79_9FUNG|nr:hypothetical protein DSO57_1025117 [Entomophthora muscae]